MDYRFDVFGMPIMIRPGDAGWQAFHIGGDGKHRLADFIVPSDIEADGLADYLADLFHEHSNSQRSNVRRLF